MLTRIPSLVCTTGWGDVSKGALLVTNDALLRVPIAMLHPMGNQFKVLAVEPGRPMELDLSKAVFEQLAVGPGKVVRINRTDVASAALREGIFNGRLSVVNQNGTKQKILWLKREGTYDYLKPVLERWLSSRLELR